MTDKPMAIEITARLMVGNREVGPNGEMPSRDGLPLTLLGVTGAICPYCAAPFSKMPQRKTKCPSCKQFVYSRTRPIDDQKVLLRESDLDLLDEEWSLVYGTHAEFLVHRARRESVRERLNANLGHEPTNEAVQLYLLHEDAVEHARQKNWGLYCNDLLAIGEILRKQSLLLEALRKYLEVCYIDLSGPQNNGGMQGFSSSPDSYPNFDKSYAMLAPGVVNRCYNAAFDLKLNKKQLKELFLEVAAGVDKDIRLPVTAAAAWKQLNQQLDLA